MTNYTYRAEFSREHCQYMGLCLEFPGRWSFALTPHQAIEAIERVIADELAELAELGVDPPEPLTDRLYSGQFTVRTSPVLHGRLAVEAVEQGVSLNQWVSYKLAGRPVPNILQDLL
jgi:predicted HicB family RNase H-like nuclease